MTGSTRGGNGRLSHGNPLTPEQAMRDGAALVSAKKLGDAWSFRPIIGWVRRPSGDVVFDDGMLDPFPGGQPIHPTNGRMEPVEGAPGMWSNQDGTERIETTYPGEPNFDRIRSAREEAEKRGLLERMDTLARRVFGE